MLRGENGVKLERKRGASLIHLRRAINTQSGFYRRLTPTTLMTKPGGCNSVRLKAVFSTANHRSLIGNII